MASAPSPQPVSIRQRLWLCAALAIPVLAGLEWMAISGAPRNYLIGNAAALALGCALILLLRWPEAWRSGRIAMIVAGLCLAGLAATILVGPEITGVRRWLPIGPLRLHGGMLLLPALAAMVPFLRGWQALLVIGVAALIFWLQPDFASALALLLAMIMLVNSFRNRWIFAGCGLGALALVATPARDHNLAAVRFVEDVIRQSFQDSILWGLFLLASLAAWLISLAVILKHLDRRAQLAACTATSAVAGYFIAALTAPFPTPLIGYSPAPIIGMGLAMGMVCAMASRDDR